MKPNLNPILLAIMAGSLSACGGGGSEDSNTTTRPVVQTQVALQSIDGQVRDTDGNVLDQVTISVNVTDADGQSLNQATTTTDDSGYYQVAMPDISAAHQVHISAEKTSFIDAESRISLADNQAFATSDFTLSRVDTVSIKREDLDAIAIGASGEQKLKITLFQSSNGSTRLVTGEAVAAADEQQQISLELPIASIDDSVEVINGEIAYFDSSEPDDIQAFPGEFLGFGETENQGQGVSYQRDSDNSEEYRLISSTFSQIKLTDQSGNPLPLSETQGASGDAPSYTFRVPYGSRSTLERDFDLTVDGIQIPIYVYRSGEGWQYVGNGLLVDLSGNPIGNEYVAEDGSLNFDNYSGSLYVTVEITDANEWIQWVNLDWPVFNEVESFDICLTGDIQYENSSNYTGSVNIRLPDGGYHWPYSYDGQFEQTMTLSTVNTSKQEALSGANWTVTVYNPRTRQTENITLPDTLSEDSCNVISYEMFNPFQCTIAGTLFEADGETAIPDRSLRVVTDQTYNYLVTDENGRYQQEVPCGGDVTVNALSQSKTATFPAEPTEKTLDIAIPNRAPYLSLYRNSSYKPVELGSTTWVSWYASDYENEDITFNVTACETQVSDTETVDCTYEMEERRATLSFDQLGDYVFTLQAKDSFGNITEKSLNIEVIPLSNQPPKLAGFEFDGTYIKPYSRVQLVEGQTGTLNILASDRNADPLTYQWSNLNCSESNCNIVGDDSLPDYTSVSVSDGEYSRSQGVYFSVLPDNAPTASIMLNKDKVYEQSQKNSEAIRALLTAHDDFTPADKLQIEWTLTRDGLVDMSDSLDTSNPLDITVPKQSIEVGSYSLAAIVTDRTINDEIGQSTSISRTFEIVSDLPPSIAITASSTDLVATDKGANRSLTLTAGVSDDLTPESDLNVTWKVSPALAYSAGDSASSIVFNAAALLPGSYTATASVTDSAGQASEAEYRFTVKRDQAPTISRLKATPETQPKSSNNSNDQAVMVSLSASDDYTTNLVTSWSVSPAVAFTADDNELVVASNQASVGIYTVTVTVKDEHGQSATADTTFEITETDSNIDIEIE